MGQMVVNQFPSGPSPIFYPRQRGPSPIEQLALLSQINRVDPGAYDRDIAGIQQRTAAFGAILQAMLQRETLAAQREENRADRVEMRDRLDKQFNLSEQRLAEERAARTDQLGYLREQLKAATGTTAAEAAERARQFDALMKDKQTIQDRLDEREKMLTGFQLERIVKDTIATTMGGTKQEAVSAESAKQENIKTKSLGMYDSGAAVIKRISVPTDAAKSLASGGSMSENEIDALTRHVDAIKSALVKNLDNMPPEQQAGAIDAANQQIDEIRRVITDKRQGTSWHAWPFQWNRATDRLAGSLKGYDELTAGYKPAYSRELFSTMTGADAAEKVLAANERYSELMPTIMADLAEFRKNNPKATAADIQTFAAQRASSLIMNARRVPSAPNPKFDALMAQY